MTGQSPSQDLEPFQRWAITVDDQLREAADAVMALQDPGFEPLSDRRHLISSDRSSGDLAKEALEKAQKFWPNPNRPAWFTPALQMVLWVSTWAAYLMDYVDDVTKQGVVVPDSQTLRVLDEKVFPALDHFTEFYQAVDAAGHLSTAADY